jgi:hypothetical protein
LLSATANQAAGKVTDISYCCRASPCPDWETPLLQEEEDDRKNGDEGGEDGGESWKKKMLHTVKKDSDFPVPDVTNQTLPGWDYFNYSRPGKV